MCFVRISEQTETFVLYKINRLVCITEVESVYSAVRIESLNKTDTFRLWWVKIRQTKTKSDGGGVHVLSDGRTDVTIVTGGFNIYIFSKRLKSL
jgi:hypothetical protein